MWECCDLCECVFEYHVYIFVLLFVRFIQACPLNYCEFKIQRKRLDVICWCLFSEQNFSSFRFFLYSLHCPYFSMGQLFSLDWKTWYWIINIHHWIGQHLLAANANLILVLTEPAPHLQAPLLFIVMSTKPQCFNAGWAQMCHKNGCSTFISYPISNTA